MSVSRFLATAASSNTPCLLDPFGPSGRPPLIWQLVPLGLAFLEHMADKDTCQEIFIKERREESAKKGLQA